MIDEHTVDQIVGTFHGADLSIIKEVVYFDGWSTYEECGGYLIFIGIDDTLQLCEYGYCVFVEDNTDYFSPRQITAEAAAELIAEMNQSRDDSNFTM